MVYCIACRLNGKEYLVIGNKNQGEPFRLFCNEKMKTVQSHFIPFYAVLTNENTNSNIYNMWLKKLLTVNPVIIAFEEYDLESIIDEWIECDIALDSPEEIIYQPHMLVSMKEGFIDKFLKLDIVRDIELTVRIFRKEITDNIRKLDIDREKKSIVHINKKGGIQFVSFKIKHPSKDDGPNVEKLTEKESNILMKGLRRLWRN